MNERNRPDMDDEHEDVQGYVYQSQACYNCHPDNENSMPGLQLHLVNKSQISCGITSLTSAARPTSARFL